jgi:hypothetical protein
MKAAKSVSYQTPKQLQHAIRQREVAIDLLPDGEVKQKMRVDVARLRSYADTKQSLSDGSSNSTKSSKR